MGKTLPELRAAYNDAVDELEKRIADFEALEDDTDDETAEAARSAYESAKTEVEARKTRLEDAEALQRAKSLFQKVEVPADEKPLNERIQVDEPDMYQKRGGRRFLDDLFASHIQKDPMATARLAKHQQYELDNMAPDVQKRALSTGTFGGLIPPNYLVGMYAKALRNGRVFADQVNHQELPETGMSIIIPRLTTGLTADIQSAENATVATQDIVETDLTVNIRTIAGYSPVSRQSLERAAYNEEILMEDLIARYNADLDTQCISGSGSGVNFVGFLNTSGIKTSAATSSSNLPAVYANVADVIQQINSAVGGLGYAADKIVVHPRRWGSWVAAVDTTNRPILGISGLPFFNVDGAGESAGYGYVGQIQGLPVYLDANVPTNLGGGSNEDAVLVMASGLVHLWEEAGQPVTLAFEQQAGTSLQVQLVAYGYAAFTAGRYPAACGKVTGLVPPTFGS
jgi:HK97 family phage major capsid protein